jgi:DNA polymerase-4/DNA polymerase V
MFQIRPWPETILHIDGDAFFASVAQAINPRLKGKPVITGHERGIATAISYEAKRYGVRRGMPGWEIKKICPQCIFVRSDYETYSLFSRRMFEILRQFSPMIEEYSVDEGFVDLKGLRGPLHTSYLELGKKIKETVEANLGITVSVGISLTKSLAKIASNFKKPSGITVIDGRHIEEFLMETPIEKVWGIGEQTSAYLKKFGVRTAYDFTKQPEQFIHERLSKPFFEIWQELRGKKVFELSLEAKNTYQSISKTQTFTPPTSDKRILWSRLLDHVEEAFAKAREFHYCVGTIHVFLKTQQFLFHGTEVKLPSKIAYPILIRRELAHAFEKIYHPAVLYRTTGCTVTNLEQNTAVQQNLFQDTRLEDRMSKIYPLIEEKKVDFGTRLYDVKAIRPPKKKPSIPFLSLEEIN